MPRHSIHESIFPENRALYIIWCDVWQGDRYSLAASHINAMLAAWDAMADYSPRDRLSLQFGSRVLRSREPDMHPRSA